MDAGNGHDAQRDEAAFLSGAQWAGRFEFLPSKRAGALGGAAIHVVVDYARGLHESVQGGRSNKTPAAAFEFLAQGNRFRCLGEFHQRIAVDFLGA